MSEPWEPVQELEYRALDTDCEPMRDDPEVPQNYGCMVIGFCLDDPEGCRSIIDITTGEGRHADEALAQLIILGLEAMAYEFEVFESHQGGDIQPHQQRVVVERDELETRRDRLAEFFDTELFVGLDAAEKDRLTRQFAIMADYSAVLGERIAAFARRRDVIEDTVVR